RLCIPPDQRVERPMGLSARDLLFEDRRDQRLEDRTGVQDADTRATLREGRDARIGGVEQLIGSGTGQTPDAGDGRFSSRSPAIGPDTPWPDRRDTDRRRPIG